MVIYSGEGLLQTDDIKARGIADFDLMSLSQRNATNKTADIGHHMMIYSGEGLLQTDAVKARGIADFVLMSLSQDKVAIKFAIQIWRIPRRAMVRWLEAITSLSETSYSDDNYL